MDDFNNKTDENSQKVKLRLRLKSGEEFEAEGSLTFVLAQKEEFLKIITKTNIKPHIMAESIVPDQNTSLTTNNTNNAINGQNNQNNNFIDTSITHKINTFPNTNPIKPIEITPLRTPAIIKQNTQNNDSIKVIDQQLWGKIAYIDGQDVVLRRKSRLLAPSNAALIILAVAKMLANIQKMTALELSKLMLLSGYLGAGDRLDRILTQDVKVGNLLFEGSKRNREYIITEQGIAKAYTSAENFLI